MSWQRLLTPFAVAGALFATPVISQTAEATLVATGAELQAAVEAGSAHIVVTAHLDLTVIPPLGTGNDAVLFQDALDFRSLQVRSHAALSRCILYGWYTRSAGDEAQALFSHDPHPHRDPHAHPPSVELNPGLTRSLCRSVTRICMSSPSSRDLPCRLPCAGSGGAAFVLGLDVSDSDGCSTCGRKFRMSVGSEGNSPLMKCTHACWCLARDHILSLYEGWRNAEARCAHL